MDNILNYDLAVIGGGASGMAAALSAYDNGIKSIIILEKENSLGGILEQCIHNGFGLHTFNEALSGPEYAQRFINKIKELNIEYKLNTYVNKITNEKDIYCSNDSDGYIHIKAKAIIMATGCVERTSGQIELAGDRVSGVMTAGLAQKYINMEGYMVGKRAFILGSGDIGLIMARRLTLEGAKVLGVAEIMPYSNGLERNIAQCLNDFNIPLYLSHTVKEVRGKNHLEKVVIAKVDENKNFISGTEMEFECDTLILSVGLLPYNLLLEDIGVKMAKTRGPLVDANYQTEIEGIFACGNNLHVHDLVDYVSEEAKQAGFGAARYLKNELSKAKNITITEPLNGISYIVPQYYKYDDIGDSITFKFRPKAPYSNVKLIIKADDKIIKEIKKIKLLPAEMENVKILKKDLPKAKKITIEVGDLNA